MQKITENRGVSSFLPLNQFVMSLWNKQFRLSFNVWAIIDTELYHILYDTMVLYFTNTLVNITRIWLNDNKTLTFI